MELNEEQKNKYALEKVVDRLKKTVKEHFAEKEKQVYRGHSPWN